MTEIVKRWLSTRLNKTFNWNPEDFGKAVRDGVVIAKLLKSYNVISTEQNDTIVSSDDLTDIKNNLLIINEWLKDIHIDLNSNDIDYLAEGLGSVALKLFYTLFLELDEKDRLYFIRKKLNTIVSDEVDKSRHTVSPVEIRKSKLGKYDNEPVQKIKPNKEALGNIYSVPFQYVKKISCDTLNYNYEDLRILEERAKQSMKRGQLVDKEHVQNYKKKLKGLKLPEKTSAGFEAEMENLILNKMLYQCKLKEDQKRSVLKFVELSKQEKELTDELLKAKHNATLVAQNRLKQQEERDRIRRIEFSKALDHLKYQIKQKNKQLNFERDIMLAFDKRLYTEELERNYCETFKLCKDTVALLLNLVFKLIEFRKMSPEDVVPEIYLHQWKTVLINSDTDYLSTSTEDILLAAEKERLILDEEDFYQYHNKTGTWDAHVNHEEENVCECIEYKGYKILNHIVKKIFLGKYPIPEHQKAPPLPNKKVATILLESKDLIFNSMFIDLLAERRILIVQINEAIAFCLEEYKKEMIEFDEITTNFVEFELSLKKSDNNVDSPTRNSLESEPLSENQIIYNSKHTQTPSKLPLVDKYSLIAQLGKLTYESLNVGESITDDLLASIIVEFLRNNSCYDGFVLVDYPKSFIQARVLEEKLSGNKVNIIPEYCSTFEMVSSVRQRTSSIQTTESSISMFQSRIIPKAESIENFDYQTYFTAFLKIKQSVSIANEECIWKLTEQNSTFIERFYADQGINYSIYFETFDETTVTFIVDNITGKTGSYSKISDNEDITDIKIASEENSKVKLLKNETRKFSAFSMNPSADSTDPPIRIDNTSAPEENSSSMNRTSLNTKSSTSSKRSLYVDFPIPSSILVNLASLWEFNESTYIENLKELFCQKRTLFSELVPYVAHIRNYLKYPVEVDPIVHTIVTSLQTDLDLIDNNMRNNSHVKADMFCKVSEMQDELKHFSRIKYDTQIYKTKKIIKEHWITKSLTSLTNIFASLMQVELNRTQSTLKIVSDYYDTILGKNITDKEQLMAFSVVKLAVGSSTHVNVNIVLVTDSLKSKGTIADNNPNSISTHIYNALINCEDIMDDDNPFHKFINVTKTAVETYLTTLETFHMSQMGKEKAKPTKNDKPKTENKMKGKPDSKEKLSDSALPKELDLNDVMTEWEDLLYGEVCRLKSRISIIFSKAVEQLSLCKDFVFHTFFDMCNLAEVNHLKEVARIDLLHNLLSFAIEKECRITSRLNIEAEDFDTHVAISHNLINEKDSLRYTKKCCFPIGQLAKLRNRLMIVAKNCSIPKKALIIMLQDFFTLHMRDQRDSPNSTYDWYLLEPDDYKIIVNFIYGDIYYVDWRDFIILCLDIIFPDQTQLLELRKRFIEFDTNHSETIQRENYYEIKLWFEPEDGSEDNFYNLRACLIKEFLFLLFEVGMDLMNYSALLLAFCRTENPEGGFIKALSLALGKTVCLDMEKCELFAQNLLYKLKEEDEYHQETIMDVVNLVTSIVDHTIRICSDVNISDIITPKASLECFNMKYLGKDTQTKEKIEQNENKSRRRSQNSRKSSVIINSTRNSVGSKIMKSKSESVNKIYLKSSGLEEFKLETEVFLISEDTVRRVLLTSLPWNCRMEFAEPYADIVTGLSQTFSELRHNVNSTCIFIHKLLEHQFIKTLLHNIHKFKMSKPCYMATEIILDRANKF